MHMVVTHDDDLCLFISLGNKQRRVMYDGFNIDTLGYSDA
jgi:hypothetical protein